MKGSKEEIAGMAALGVAFLVLAINFAEIGGHHGPRAQAQAELGGAPVEVHYAPAENLERIDVALIDAAGERIDMAAYVLTDWAVIEALIDAANRGVTVRIWRDPGQAERTAAAEEAKLESAPGIAVRIKPPGELMHMKSYCIDGKTLRSGAANFSASGEKRQDNDLVVLRGPGVCARFEANFEKIWGE